MHEIKMCSNYNFSFYLFLSLFKFTKNVNDGNCENPLLDLIHLLFYRIHKFFFYLPSNLSLTYIKCTTNLTFKDSSIVPPHSKCTFFVYMSEYSLIQLSLDNINED